MVAVHCFFFFFVVDEGTLWGLVRATLRFRFLETRGNRLLPHGLGGAAPLFLSSQDSRLRARGCGAREGLDMYLEN